MPYRSKLEGKVAASLGDGWEYEPERVEYTMVRKYTPDFTKGNIVAEVKGFFRPGDQAKYIAIRDQLRSEGRELVFIFSQPNKPVRRGAKLTHAKWCDKKGIRYCSAATCRGFFDGDV